MKLFDSHCHLQDTQCLPNLESVVERAVAAGVEKMVCCATAPADWNAVLRGGDRFSDRLIPMLGIHPWFVRADWATGLRSLKTHLEQIPGLGIGETGLDFQERFRNRSLQEACFAAQLDLACELNRPIVVHCVRAWGRMMEILREHPAPKILLHAFGGSVELIPELVRLNSWFSFGGALNHPRAKRARAAVAAVPIDRLLIETDASVGPQAGQVSPSEPAHLMRVAHAVAQLRGQSVEAIACVTWMNSAVLFCNFV